MSKLFVFAIGGTGERVLRSFTMLLAAGVPAFDNYDIYPIIIDYDVASGDKERAMKSLKNYVALHDAAFARHGRQGNQFFGAEIKQVNGLKNFVLSYEPMEGEERFREYIGYSNLNGETVNTKYMLDSMYDTSERPTTELNLDMTVGFKGNPNIGCVVFHKLKENEGYNSFRTNYNANQGDRIVIIGSLFGGTGASGIPELVQAIKEDKPNAIIATTLILPYFEPKRNMDGAINANLFYSKTKAALNYYKDSGLNDSISAIYYLGDPYPTVVPYCEGGSEQRNNANLVEVLAGLTIAHFAKLPQPNTNREFKFSLEKNIIVDPNDVHRLNCRLFINDFDDNTKGAVLKYMTALATAMKYYHDVIEPANINDSPYFDMLELDKIEKSKTSEHKANRLQDICGHLHDFYSLFVQWMNELDFAGDDAKNIPANSHRLALYNLSNEYHEIILKETEKTTDKDKGVIEVIKTVAKKITGPTVKPNKDFLDSTMNTSLGYYCEGAKLTTNEKEFVFMDILHTTALKAEQEIKKNKL